MPLQWRIYITNSGRDWRKVPESDARSVTHSLPLSELLTAYTPSRQFRSSADTRADTRTLRIPHVETKTFGFFLRSKSNEILFLLTSDTFSSPETSKLR